jgi:hypothetical protein
MTAGKMSAEESEKAGALQGFVAGSASANRNRAGAFVWTLVSIFGAHWTAGVRTYSAKIGGDF